MVARSIHFSDRVRTSLSSRDCGSLVPTLIESELFGYVKERLPEPCKPKMACWQSLRAARYFSTRLESFSRPPGQLLRAIQEKEIRPVGSTKRIAINVRILAATNRDLEQAVAQGMFRRDLHFFTNCPSCPVVRESARIPMSGYTDSARAMRNSRLRTFRRK